MRPKTKIEDKVTYCQTDQSLACLKSAQIFSTLSDKDLACFQEAAQLRAYKKGKILYLEEDPAKFFYIIKCGWIKLSHVLPEGLEVVVDMLTMSQTVGTGTVFEHGRHTSNAQVIEDAELLCLPLSLLKDQLLLNAKLALNMLAFIYRLHRHTCTDIALNSKRRVPQRIGNFLLKLCPNDKKNDVVFYLPYDKTIIANSLGMTRGSFSRALNILEDKTSVHVAGARVEITSVVKLERFVYGPLSIKAAPENK